MTNYRKFYEEQTGEKIPQGFEVHHIDHDRTNNDIKNLVALPRKLHREYHKSHHQVQFFLQDNLLSKVKPINMIFGGEIFNEYRGLLEEMDNYIRICMEVSEYISERHIKIQFHFKKTTSNED